MQEYHVWVAITIEILADYFETIDYTMYSSMVYRLKREIPARVLQKFLAPTFRPPKWNTNISTSLSDSGESEWAGIRDGTWVW